jgi:hypothetical protein
LAATGKEEHLACGRPAWPTWYNYQVLPCKNYQVPPGEFCIKKRTMEYGAARELAGGTECAPGRDRHARRGGGKRS